MFLGPWSKKTCGMIILAIALFIIVAIAFSSGFKEVIGGAGSDSGQADSRRMLEEGKQIFRHDTFGSEDFWGGELRLHEAIKGARLGRSGAGCQS